MSKPARDFELEELVGDQADEPDNVAFLHLSWPIINSLHFIVKPAEHKRPACKIAKFSKHEIVIVGSPEVSLLI